MAESVAKPKVLLVSCCLNAEREDLLKGLTNFNCEGLDGDSNGNNDDVHFSEYDWSISNKYYSADLSLILAKYPKPSTEIKEITNEVEGVIISFELKNDLSFTRASEWGRLFQENDIEIKILMAVETEELDGLEAAVERANDWCLKNSFEFVESFHIDTEDEDFPEKSGFERVREVLDAHLWPNMVRKPKESTNQKDMKKHQEDGCSAIKDVESDDAIYNGNEEQLESFEELFGQMHEMKLHAQSLPDDQRKEYAEKVTLAFWRAMGFDEEEISGL